MENQPAILIQNLIKYYGNVPALSGVNLEVHKGEIFGFLGPNGAGKTTTIRCLLDMIRPNSGHVQILGLDPQKDPFSVHERTGYLPGELHFDENLKVDKLLQYLINLRGGTINWDTVVKFSTRLDLDLQTKIKNLSKGNKQKVGIIQAMMHEPELLILDEPTSGLDPLLQQEVLKLIQEANQQGASVFFSSHNLSEVQEISNRVGIIRKGKIIEIAETETLITRAIRRVLLRFREPISPNILTAIPGTRILSSVDDLSIRLEVEGDIHNLIKLLAQLPLADIETERPSLEEVFLTYYNSR